MQKREKAGDVLALAGLAAQIILENGAETYRVEDTVQRLCRSYGFEDTEVLALSTGVVVSITVPGHNETVIRRVSKRQMDLWRVNAVNALSRQVAQKGVPLAEARARMEAIARRQAMGDQWMIPAAALVAASFALMFGGGWLEFCVALAAGAAAQAVAYAFRRAEISLVLSSLTGGLVCSAVTMLAFYLFGLSPASVETILSGAIMPLISGLMMTNAVRDALRGDLLSAMARGMEALLVAVMVALGISLLLRFYLPVEVEPLAEPGWAMAVVTAGLATLFFCPLLDAPPRAMAPSALLGMVSYGLYLALRDAAMVGETLSLFFTAAAIALLCALMARRMRMITTIFLCAAMIPLVPGLGLFRTMRALLLAQYDMAISAGLQTLFAVGAIALGAALGSMRLHKPKRARPEKER
ncbi:MAG: threonine/serine exporter family protein [Christensenellales bacterium]|nr:threonine/serine exporter family protein [Christensenellales bacterium]